MEFAVANGLYISTLEWHHFVTLTVDTGATSHWLLGEYHDRFIRRLAFHARRRINHFVAIERDDLTGRFAHLHALLHGTAGMTVQEIRHYWPCGYTNVAPYDRRQHAAHYVVKDLLLDPDSYHWSRIRPPQLVEWSGPIEDEFRASVAALRARVL